MLEEVQRDQPTSHLQQVIHHQGELFRKLNESKWRLRKVTLDLGGPFDEPKDSLETIISENPDHILCLREISTLMDKELGDIHILLERLELLTSK